MPRWTVATFGMAATAFFVGLAADIEWLRVATKPIPVLVLAVAVGSHRPPSRFRRLVTVGLVFGATGDLLLELGWFVVGLAAFLVGHLWYLAALVGRNRRPALALALPFAVWAIALPWALADGAGDLLVPVAAYAVVLCSAMWRSGALLQGGVARTSAIALFTGFIVFGISDSLIAIDRFGTDLGAWSRWAIMLTYWSAQALIAWGAIRSDADEQLPKDAG